jgi:hypothetical protein
MKSSAHAIPAILVMARSSYPPPPETDHVLSASLGESAELFPNKQILIDKIAAWEHDRNADHTKADWQFTTKNARIKLKHLYPAI